MTNWVNLRVPEADRDRAKEVRPEGATHGDCLVAGAQALADGDNGVDQTDAATECAIEPDTHLELAAIEDLKESLSTVESRLNSIERTLEEVTRR